MRQSDEDNPRGYFEYEPVKQTSHDASWLATAGGKAVKIIYKLLYDLPSDYPYRLVFMQRPLSEVVASQRAMLQRQGAKGAKLDDAALTAVFGRELDRVLDWIEQQPCFELHSVAYHDLLRNADNAAASLAGFLQQPVDEQAMARAVDPALYRQCEQE